MNTNKNQTREIMTTAGTGFRDERHVPSQRRRLSVIGNLLRFAFAMLAGLFLSCSTTSRLPEGETLYTGIKYVQVEGNATTSTAAHAMDEIEAALAYPPNNALFGSSSTRMPFPAGLWIYNAFVDSKGGIGKWIYNQFAAKPVFISTANPGVRTAIASNLLRENGYFEGASSYEIIPNAKNPRKAKIGYRIELNHLYTYDSIRYVRTRSFADSLFALHPDKQLLRPGAPFNVASLEAERQRISTFLRSQGFYYHRPEFTIYQADTLLSPGKVWLRVMRKPGLPQAALTPFAIGNISVALNGYKGEEPTDSVSYNGLTVYYEGKLRERAVCVSFSFSSE
ncbi:hypothetical protein FACS1894181_17710 [Bacteroidia bacterium]|nr:hypothetical protein FACS1894181_17710 [Bacteroidia bacterium]